MDIRTVTARFQSVKPGLLMHSDQAMLAEKKPKAKTQEEEAELAAYRNEKGELILKTCAFRNSLLTGSTGRKAKPEKGMPMMALWKVFSATAHPLEDFCVLTNAKGKPLTDYLIDKRTAVNKMKGRILVCRPHVPEWFTEMRIEVDLDWCPTKLLAEVWNIAGRIVGVGAFRVEKKGVFGRYTVEIS